MNFVNFLESPHFQSLLLQNFCFFLLRKLLYFCYNKEKGFDPTKEAFFL